MSRFAIFAFVLFSAAASLMDAASAQSLAVRTFISGVGDDANPCSRTQPCRTFGGALDKTLGKGQITCLDAVSAGSIVITKSVTIDCHGVMAGVLTGATGIVVNVASTDKVIIIGLDIDGIGLGDIGVKMIGAGAVDIYDSTIRNFTGNGISVMGTAGASVSVHDSIITNNGGGIEVNGASGASNLSLIDHVRLMRNTSFAVKASATGVVVLNDSFLAGSPSAIATSPGASVQSYGNNVLRNAGLPTVTLPLK